MKKAIFFDKAPSRVRILFQIQNLDTFESMKTVTLQVLQHNAQYQAGVTVLHDNEREESNDMEIDALTKEGSSHKGKGKSRAERQKSSCSGCGQRHMNRECWFKDTNKVETTKDCRLSRGEPRNSKNKRGKGKGKGYGKNSVDKITTPKEPKGPKESTVTSTGGGHISTSQISRISQVSSSWDQPHIQNASEENEAGYISATVRYREPPHQSEDWYAFRILVDNCADEHVCSPQDFEWIEIEPSENPNLVSA